MLISKLVEFIVVYSSISALLMLTFGCSFTSYFLVKAKVHKLSCTVEFVYKCLPVIVISDPKGLLFEDEYQVGAQLGPVIVIGGEAEEAIEIKLHELEHVKKGYQGLFLWSSYKHITDKKYRILCEYDAHMAEGVDYTQEYIAENLYEGYNLAMTQAQILKVIKENR